MHWTFGFFQYNCPEENSRHGGLPFNCFIHSSKGEADRERLHRNHSFNIGVIFFSAQSASNAAVTGMTVINQLWRNAFVWIPGQFHNQTKKYSPYFQWKIASLRFFLLYGIVWSHDFHCKVNHSVLIFITDIAARKPLDIKPFWYTQTICYILIAAKPSILFNVNRILPLLYRIEFRFQVCLYIIKKFRNKTRKQHKRKY